MYVYCLFKVYVKLLTYCCKVFVNKSVIFLMLCSFLLPTKHTIIVSFYYYYLTYFKNKFIPLQSRISENSQQSRYSMRLRRSLNSPFILHDSRNSAYGPLSNQRVTTISTSSTVLIACGNPSLAKTPGVCIAKILL